MLAQLAQLFVTNSLSSAACASLLHLVIWRLSRNAIHELYLGLYRRRSIEYSRVEHTVDNEVDNYFTLEGVVYVSRQLWGVAVTLCNDWLVIGSKVTTEG